MEMIDKEVVSLVLEIKEADEALGTLPKKGK